MLDLYKERTVLLMRKYQVILKKIMLESLVINNSYVSYLHMDDISDMKCQLQHLHLYHYIIFGKYDQNFQHLC